MDTAARPNPDRIVKLADAGALIAALPSLMGFHPANSFLVVTLKDGIIGLTVRVDLPPPELHTAVIGRVMRPVRQARAEHAVVLVVCADRDPAHGDLVRRTVAAIVGAGMPVLHAVWAPAAVGGAPWRCYLHDDCEGEVPDPAGTECAAAMTLAGLVTFESRDDLVRLLEPPDADHMIRLSGLLDVTSQSDRTPSAAHLSAVRAAIESGALPTTDEEFVRLAMALSDHRVRDACLGFVLDSAVTSTAEKLWLELARCLPPPERAEAASLLAASAYLRGDGALANVALEQARGSMPDHSLAGLLQGAIDYGVPLIQIHQSLTDAAVDAHIDIAAEPTDLADELGNLADGLVDAGEGAGDSVAGPGDIPEEFADATGPVDSSTGAADPSRGTGDATGPVDPSAGPAGTSAEFGGAAGESAGLAKGRERIAKEPDVST